MGEKGTVHKTHWLNTKSTVLTEAVTHMVWGAKTWVRHNPDTAKMDSPVAYGLGNLLAAICRKIQHTRKHMLVGCTARF